MSKGPRDPGIEMVVWVLDKTEQELEAAKGDRRRLRALKKCGPLYNPELYRQDGHPGVTSDRQHQTRKSLERLGLLDPYPKLGHVTHLKLTEEGKKAAIFYRDNGRCSPEEIKRAVRKSSQFLRECIRLNERVLSGSGLSLDEARHFTRGIIRYQVEVERLEQACGQYLKTLPPEQMRAEAKRIAKEGWIEPPPVPTMPAVPNFTDGGTVPFPRVHGREIEAPDKALN